jgi:hypothetical protein
MKKTLLTLAIAVGGNNALACGPVEGVWELEYALRTDKTTGKVLYEKKKNVGNIAIKFLTRGEFSYTLVGDKGLVIGAHTGSYEIRNGIYTELVRYSTKGAIMRLFDYQCSMKDGTWIIKAIDKNFDEVEHWKPERVKATLSGANS